MEDQDSKPTLGRRNLLRGGVAVATVAGLSATAAVATASPASAAPVDYVRLGDANAETTTTAITVNGTTGSPSVAALSLANADGPALKLNTLSDDWEGSLESGEIANTESGPIVGLADGSTTYLATGEDLESMPLTVPIPPVRLVDLRTAAGRVAVAGSSAGAFDSQHRLKAGHWMDISLGRVTDGVFFAGLYANITSTKADARGYLTVYPPLENSRPAASSLNFSPGQDVANMVFTGLSVNESGQFVVRIYASQTTFVILDINGAIVLLIPESTISPAAAGRTTSTPRRKNTLSSISSTASKMLKAAGGQG